MPRSQLTQTYGKRLTGQKRRNYNYPSKYFVKKWNQAPGGQNGGTITKIRQVTNLGFIQTTDVSGDAVDCFAFRLRDLPNHEDYKYMYDMYRIVKVIVHFLPRYTNANISANGGIKTSILYTAKDYNDINSPANADEVAAYQTAKFSLSTEKHVRSIKPLLVAQTIPPEGETAQAIPYSPSPNAWINIDNDNEYYAGIKVALRATTGYYQGFWVEAEYHVEFKNIK